MENKVYILQKNFLDYMVGDFFEFDVNGYVASNGRNNGLRWRWPPEWVENNPEWFLLKENKSNDSFLPDNVIAMRKMVDEYINNKPSGLSVPFPSLLEDLISYVNSPEYNKLILEERAKLKQSYTPKPQAEDKELVAVYHGRPSDKKDFETEIKKTSEYYGKNILCEECGEIGKHKRTCSQAENKSEFDFLKERMKNIPNHTKEKVKNFMDKLETENKPDWEIVAYIDEFEFKSRIFNKDTPKAITCKGDTRFVIAYDNNFPIHSVKRLSDGEVFSVGDEVGYYDCVEPINSFYINEYDKKMWAKCYRDKIRGTVFDCPLSELIKQPQPQKKEQRIEVGEITQWNMTDVLNGGRYLRVNISDYLSPTKVQLLKKVIDSAINNDAKRYWELVDDFAGKVYTQEQVDSMCEDAFSAGRLYEGLPKDGKFIFTNYTNYKNSIKNKPNE